MSSSDVLLLGPSRRFLKSILKDHKKDLQKGHPESFSLGDLLGVSKGASCRIPKRKKEGLQEVTFRESDRRATQRVLLLGTFWEAPKGHLKEPPGEPPEDHLQGLMIFNKIQARTKQKIK